MIFLVPSHLLWDSENFAIWFWEVSGCCSLWICLFFGFFGGDCFWDFVFGCFLSPSKKLHFKESCTSPDFILSFCFHSSPSSPSCFNLSHRDLQVQLPVSSSSFINYGLQQSQEGSDCTGNLGELQIKPGPGDFPV